MLAAYNVIPYYSWIDPNFYNEVPFDIFYIQELIEFLAFAVLAYIYYSERRARGIKITRLHWIVGGLVVGTFFSLLAYLILTVGYLTLDLGQAISWSLFVIGIPVLEIYIIVSLFSYYKGVKNKNTLIVMAGFVCLFSYYLVITFLSYLLSHVWDYDVSFVFALASALTLAGYTLFLVALLRPKGSR
jgi:hypothetical protein